MIVAASQTAGRGRLGRSWFSPPGAGLYASLVFRSRLHPDSPMEPAAIHLRHLPVSA